MTLTKKMALRTGMRMSEDGKAYFDEQGNEIPFNCFFCGRVVRRGVDICWKCERDKHLNFD